MADSKPEKQAAWVYTYQDPTTGEFQFTYGYDPNYYEHAPSPVIFFGMLEAAKHAIAAASMHQE